MPNFSFLLLVLQNDLLTVAPGPGLNEKGVGGWAGRGEHPTDASVSH